MALANKVDPQAVQAPLAAAIARHLGVDGVAVSNVTVPANAGMSNETLMFDAEWKPGGRRELVARVHPAPDTGLFMSYDMEREHRLMRALEDNDAVPVPKVLFADTEGRAIGSPLLVMERVDGRPPADDPPFTVAGWMLDLDPGQRAQVFDRAIEGLAAIHGVDWDALGLGFLNDGEAALGPLDARLAYERRFYAWAAGGQEFPIIDAAFEWLGENHPQDEGELVLNWGDSRISNMIFDDDLEVRAVIDWEMASVASPELDLGWWMFGMRHHTEGIGAPLPEGMPDSERFIARYCELTGRALRDLGFYEVLAGTRGAIMMVRAAQMMVDAGFLPADTAMARSNPASHLLARMIGVEAPSGDSTSFIGNRQ